MKAGVIGAGAWGTALAQLLASDGQDVALWALEPDVVEGKEHGVRVGHQAFSVCEAGGRARLAGPGIILLTVTSNAVTATGTSTTTSVVVESAALRPKCICWYMRWATESHWGGASNSLSVNSR